MATSKEYFEKNTFLEFGTELSFEAADGVDIVVPVKVAFVGPNPSYGLDELDFDTAINPWQLD
jgi:hypothetical protein